MWFKESNRDKHFLYAIPCGLIGGLPFAIGLATGMEFKDKLYGNKFDWIDWAMTVAGGVLGQAIQVLCLLPLLK